LTVFFLHRGGLVYYGGFIGAAVGVWLFARAHAMPVLGLYDFVVTSVPLAHAFGRVGCLLNGCCFGRPWSGPLAIRYPAESLPWWRHLEDGLIDAGAARSAAVHPVPLYETAFNLLLYAGLVVLYRRRPRAGVTAACYLLAYPAWRFGIEFLRGDPRLMLGPLTVSQATSLALLGVGTAVLLRALRRRARE
ncbi:MAG: prolipoprotein diacylglyceryl transferase, partial [Lentisphaerae bacterium]|nr:prolipoprotein diacylglyceryl transferase [Lentisphaerota bacterium]